MEDKLVTLAILTYAKAQILKNVLENEGIETYIHNVNQIQPVVSSGVRVRIKESDLPHALKITESSAWLSEEVVGEKIYYYDVTLTFYNSLPFDIPSTGGGGMGGVTAGMALMLGTSASAWLLKRKKRKLRAG